MYGSKFLILVLVGVYELWSRFFLSSSLVLLIWRIEREDSFWTSWRFLKRPYNKASNTTYYYRPYLLFFFCSVSRFHTKFRWFGCATTQQKNTSKQPWSGSVCHEFWLRFVENCKKLQNKFQLKWRGYSQTLKKIRTKPNPLWSAIAQSYLIPETSFIL